MEQVTLANLKFVIPKWRLINTILFVIFFILPWLNGCSLPGPNPDAENSTHYLNGFHMLILAFFFLPGLAKDLITEFTSIITRGKIYGYVSFLILTLFPFALILYHFFGIYQFFKPGVVNKWWRWGSLLVIVYGASSFIYAFGDSLLFGFWLTTGVIISSLVLEVVEKLIEQYATPMNNRPP